MIPDMTLRDYFAAAALTGMLQSDYPTLTNGQAAIAAYQQADAMIAARGTPPDSQDVARAVEIEREECAKIAEAAELAYKRASDSVATTESWGWALNEMADDVSERYFAGVGHLCEVAEKIRERGKDQG